MSSRAVARMYAALVDGVDGIRLVSPSGSERYPPERSAA